MALNGGEPILDRASLLSRLQRDVNTLADPEKAKRKRAIVALTTALLDASPKAPPFPLVADLVIGDLLTPILAIVVSDPAESCREAAIAFLGKLLTLDAHDGSLRASIFPRLVPALASRLGRLPLPEDAEDLRLRLIGLLNECLVAPQCAPAAAAFASDIADVLACASSDAFHAVKVEAAAGVAHLARAAPGSVHFCLERLISGTLPNLGHQRGPVRSAALDAIHASLVYGGESLGRILGEAAIPALRGVRFDRLPALRRQLAVASGSLLSSLPPHALHAALPPSSTTGPGGTLLSAPGQSVESHLLVLCCALAADDVSEVAEGALAALEKAAAARVAAREASHSSPEAGRGARPAALAPDLAVAAEAAAAGTGPAPPSAPSLGAYSARFLDAPRLGDPHHPWQSAGASSGSHALHTGGGSAAGPGPGFGSSRSGPAGGSGAALAWWPPHFEARPPSPALVALASALLAPSLAILLPDLRDWTARARISAAGALRSLLALSQASAVGHIDSILTALCSGAHDDEADVRTRLSECAKVMGSWVPPEAQLGVLLPQLRGEVSGLTGGAHAAAALFVLAGTISSLSHDRLLPHVRSVALTLASPALAEDDPADLRSALESALSATVGALCGAPPLLLLHTSGAAQAAAGLVAQKGGRPTRRLSHGVPSGSSLAPLPASSHDGFWGHAPAVPLDEDTVDALLLCLLHLQDASSTSEVAARARSITHVLAGWLGARYSVDIYAAAAHRILPRLLADVGTWSAGSHNRRVFDTLVRVARPSLAGRSSAESAALIAEVVRAFVSSLGPSRDAELRVAQFALLDSFLLGSGEDDDASGAPHAAGASPPGHLDAGSAGGPAASYEPIESAPSPVVAGMDVVPTLAVHTADEAMLRAAGAHLPTDSFVDAQLRSGGGAMRILEDALLPTLVWRPGPVASTLRKVAVACALSALSRGLLPSRTLLPALPTLLPPIRTALSDDEATTRHLSARLCEGLCAVARRQLDPDLARGLYADLLKRLDDANDAVRCAACAALTSLAHAPAHAAEELRGTVIEYTLDTLLVHLDDTDARVQAAVFDAMLAWGALAPTYALKVASAARDKHRSPAYCDRLIAALGTGDESALKLGGGGHL